jgi:hypothetical protein
LTEEGSELGDQISVISSEKQKRGGGLTHQLSDTTRFASAGWHSDITFEPVPSDYAMLKIHTLPSTGGDTLWASGYEVYDRLSPALAQFLEGLTATHEAKFFHEEAARLGNPLRTTIRGSPLNQGPALEAVHPIIRTNPVTGWKSVYVNRGFTRRINGVTKDESDVLLQYLFNVSQSSVYSLALLIQVSSSHKTMMRKSASSGRRTISQSGTTDPPGTRRHTITTPQERVIVFAPWARSLSSILLQLAEEMPCALRNNSV